jgi:hypothetical protein
MKKLPPDGGLVQLSYSRCNVSFNIHSVEIKGSFVSGYQR